jgi:hypothetical protein
MMAISAPLTNAAVSVSSCPAVNCDCNFVAAEKWQKLCKAREDFITKGCIQNAGKPTSYCGLHGPAAFPVATSLQFSQRPKIDSKMNFSTLIKMEETQEWSLADDFKVLKEKEKSGNVVDALRIFGLFRKNSQKLFDIQQQVVLGYTEKNKESSAVKFARKFSEPTIALAKELNAYSDELWQTTFSLKSGNRKKAYKTLAFKISREAAAIYERGADLHASGTQYREAADTWQKAAEISKKLLKWEESTSNKLKYIAHYQNQSSARINRATLYWLLSDQTSKATANIESVRDDFSAAEEKVMSESEPRELQATTME